MSDKFSSLSLAVLRNKIYELHKAREENYKKLKELENQTNSLSRRITAISDKIDDLQCTLNEKMEAENVKIVQQFLTSTASIPNRSISIGFFRIDFKQVTSEEETLKLLQSFIPDDWQDTDKKQIVETTTYCPYPDYWEDDTKSIDFFVSKENPKTKEVIHTNWYANYTKNRGHFSIKNSKLKLNRVRQLIYTLQTNPNINDFVLSDYPNLMSAIVKVLQQ